MQLLHETATYVHIYIYLYLHKLYKFTSNISILRIKCIQFPFVKLQCFVILLATILFRTTSVFAKLPRTIYFVIFILRVRKLLYICPFYFSGPITNFYNSMTNNR